MNSIEERVIKVTTKVLGIKWHSELHAESNFSDDLGADSLDKTELVMSLEDEFDIELFDVDDNNLHTVKQVCDYIEGKLND